MNQPLDSHTTTVHAAGTGARMHAHIERHPTIAPWVVVKADDTSAVSLILSFDQTRQLYEALGRCLLAGDITDAEVAA